MCSDSTRWPSTTPSPAVSAGSASCRRQACLARPRLYRDRGGPGVHRRRGPSCTATIGWRSRSMFVATIVDATDGVLARRVRVKEVLPDVDGARIDDIVDYLTFVFLPMLLLEGAGGLYRGMALPVIAVVLMSSMYGFVAPDAKSNDHFFTGFPSYWNIVVLYLLLFRVPPLGNALVLLVLSALVFVRIGYVYPVAHAGAARADAGARVGVGASLLGAIIVYGRRRRAGWRSAVARVSRLLHRALADAARPPQVRGCDPSLASRRTASSRRSSPAWSPSPRSPSSGRCGKAGRSTSSAAAWATRGSTPPTAAAGSGWTSSGATSRSTNRAGSAARLHRGRGSPLLPSPRHRSDRARPRGVARRRAAPAARRRAAR